MPTYILLTTLTAQGVQTLKANPERLREVNRDAGPVRLHQRGGSAGSGHHRAGLGRARRARQCQTADDDRAFDRRVPGRGFVTPGKSL
jgi:hypothetical protein